MLVDIALLEPYNGVQAGQCTQVTEDIAEALIGKGHAVKVEAKKQTTSETKKVGK